MLVKLGGKEGKVRLDNKQYTEDELANHLANGGTVGWLVSDGYVVVDIDNMEDSDVVYKMLEHEGIKFGCHTTRKGKHFFFKSPNTKKIIPQVTAHHTPIGIKIDTRTSGKGYVVLPVNDPNRKVLKAVAFDDFNSLDSIPFWLKPLEINNTNDCFVKVGMKEHDGRNDALFKQIFRLKGALLTPKQIEKVVRLINQFVFAEPEEEAILKATVLREEVLNAKLQLDEKKFDHTLMADKILHHTYTLEDSETVVEEGYHLKYYQDDFYVYNNGKYSLDYQSMWLKQIMTSMFKRIKESQRKEVLHYLKTQVFEQTFNENRDFINCLNGLYSLKDNKLIPHNPQTAGRIQMSFNYGTKKVIPEVDQFLLDLADGCEERAQLIKEMIGFGTTLSADFNKVFFLYGASASNGKTTLTNVITALVGEDNVANEPLDKIHNSPYSVAELKGKTLNIVPDISAKYLEDVSTIKGVTGGDKVRMEKKFKDPEKAHITAKFIFGCNELPKVPKDEGWYRRVVIIPFYRQFTEDNTFDVNTLIDNQDALDYLGTMCVDAFVQVLKSRKWSNQEETTRLLNEYKIDSDNALSFLNDYEVLSTDIITVGDKQFIPKAVLYQNYKEYCITNGFHTKSNVSFSKTIQDILPSAIKKNKHCWEVNDKVKISSYKSTDIMTNMIKKN